jgi:hypothetical protein
MAMGFKDGRCKLVLSMRGNPDAEKVLEQVPAEQRAMVMEAMAAHEVGHCWRYAQGNWHALPAGFEENDNPAEVQQILQNQREEGFADLVALAWTRRQHRANYSQLHGWLSALRGGAQTVAGGSHDTRAWIRLAQDEKVFTAGATPFDEAMGAWSAGLVADE